MTQSIPAPVTARYGDAIEAELQRWLAARPEIGRHYDMLAYHMGWRDETLAPNQSTRGKRFRPLMCLLACEAVGGSWQAALSIAASLEFLHNFSLIHDDIEDHDEARHHRPTLWKLCGDPLAINAGDAMLALAGLAALSAHGVTAIPLRFQETALALTEGQYLDMTFETRDDVTVNQYFQMIGLKTAALIRCSCEIGGLMGGGADAQVAALREFGHHFGVAYQIFDDIRGIWSASSVTGKVAAKDIVNRKKSLPILLALQVSAGGDREQLVHYYGSRQGGEPEAVIRILDNLGIRSQTEAALQSELRTACAALNSADLRPGERDELLQLALGLVTLGD